MSIDDINFKFFRKLDYNNLTLDDFNYIFLSEFNGLFSDKVISALRNNLHVYNLSQLFELYDLGILFNAFSDKYENYVLTGVKLLKCKFLGLDPKIDEDNDNIIDICEKLGLSKEVSNALIRYKSFNPNFNFFELIREPDALNKLSKIRNIGEVFAKEIYERAIIVVNYHDKHKEDKKEVFDENDEKETLEYLYSELKRLREDSVRIDKEIGVILGKIEEKTLKDSKGGIKK